jgi:hypothetical protein
MLYAHCMKKLLLLSTAIVGTTGLVQATTITAPSSLIGSDTLQGVDAYSWGINIAVPSGQEVTSAQINFTSIDLTASGNSQGTGTIYTDLLNSKNTGLTTAYDGDAAGDYWATQFSGANISSLGSKFFQSVGTTLTWSIVLNSTELDALNSYLTANNGVFNIGIDPDCHYNVGNITFSYNEGGIPTTFNHVPDAATTAFLLVFGLAGLELFRRRVVVAKAKA